MLKKECRIAESQIEKNRLYANELNVMLFRKISMTYIT